MKRKLIAVVLAFGIPFLAYLLCLNYTEAYEAGIAWNRFTGTLWLQDGGMHFTLPWVAVSRVDTRPQRVCLTSTGRGSFNCRLVQFVPSAYKEFVAVDGHRYYWWSNRFSFNSGYDDEYRGMKDLLRGYAYADTAYPFVAILSH